MLQMRVWGEGRGGAAERTESLRRDATALATFRRWERSRPVPCSPTRSICAACDRPASAFGLSRGSCPKALAGGRREGRLRSRRR
jgi:hypothetical protein